MPTLYIATSNAGKLQEFATAAQPSGWTIAPLPSLATLPAPPEDAPTFAGNADLKAIAYSRTAPNLLVLADDSGLVVDALDGRPGVLSARFADSLHFDAGEDATKDVRNNRCLLAMLAALPSPTQASDIAADSARFVCALSVARDGEVLLRAEGTVEGMIRSTSRGTNGFGYDPLFTVRSRGLTLAELSQTEKWSVSHRGNAFRVLLQQLPRIA